MRTALSVIYIIGIAGVLAIGFLLLLTAFPIPGLDMDARVVQTGSMEPAIPTGSVIFITPADTYSVGDVATFRRSGFETPTTHRIVGIHEEDGSFITQGDANEVVDMNPITEDMILGAVNFHIPFLGHAINFTRRPLGFILLIMIPVILISVDEVRKIHQELGKSTTKEDQ